MKALNPESREFYVYALYDTNGFPFYIGKGKDRRLNRHFQKSNLKHQSYKNNLIKKILSEKGNVNREIICKNLTEKEAYELEEFMINSYGLRVDGGCLTNVLKSVNDFVQDASEVGRKKSLISNVKITEKVALELIKIKSENPEITFEKLGEMFNVSGARVCDFFNKKHKSLQNLQFDYEPKKLRVFSKEIASQIIFDKSQGLSVEDLCEKYKISRTHVYRILNKKVKYLFENEL